MLVRDGSDGEYGLKMRDGLHALKHSYLITGNLGFQHFTGKVDTAFDSAQWFFQDVCYFEVLKSVQVQNKRFLKDHR